jgi:mannose-6-phosphate isomerase
MTSTWQRYGRLNNEVRELRDRLERLQAVADAAEVLVHSPQSEGARRLVEGRLLDAEATPAVEAAPQRRSLADGTRDALRHSIREHMGPDAKMVPKPWGYEVWWAVTEHYAGKILHVTRGHRLSLQYHETKDESCYLLAGRIALTRGASVDELETVTIEAGAIWRNQPGEIHTIEALEESDVLEVSTPQLDDVVRLQDDYGRTETTQQR